MSWRGEEGGIEAARQKHNVIMTPHTYLYFDYYQTYDIKNEPLAIGGRLPLERVYNYDPMPKVLSPEEQKYIVGVQANLWTEYISTFRYAEYMLLPRLAALSEIQWSSADKKNYECFLSPIHYTLDGSEPTAASPLYTDTLKIKEACTISAVGIRPARKTRLFTETVNIP